MNYVIFMFFKLISLFVISINTFSPQVCVYINKHGDCGPHLDHSKIQELPDHFGPGPVNVVLRRTVQACVDCAIKSKTVFGFLKTDNHDGEVITGMLIYFFIQLFFLIDFQCSEYKYFIACRLFYNSILLTS